MTPTIPQVEFQLKAAKEQIAFAAEIHKLVSDRRFKKLILEDFCTDTAARLVHESSDPALDPAQRADCLSMAQAGGHLRRWLSVQLRQAELAERNIPDLEAALTEMRGESGDADGAGELAEYADDAGDE